MNRYKHDARQHEVVINTQRKMQTHELKTRLQIMSTIKPSQLSGLFPEEKQPATQHTHLLACLTHSAVKKFPHIKHT